MQRGKLALIITLITIISIDISYFVKYGNPFNTPPTGIYCVFAGITSIMLVIVGTICLVAYIIENWNKEI